MQGKDVITCRDGTGWLIPGYLGYQVDLAQRSALNHSLKHHGIVAVGMVVERRVAGSQTPRQACAPQVCAARLDPRVTSDRALPRRLHPKE